MANKQLTFEQKQVLCLQHGEPFRAKWPAGWLTFAVEASKAILEDEAFGQEADGKTYNIMPLLDVKPICCRLSREKLLELFRDVHTLLNSKRPDSPWKVARCDACEKKRLGSPYIVLNSRGKLTYDHLCFHCMIYALKPDPNLN